MHRQIKKETIYFLHNLDRNIPWVRINGEGNSFPESKVHNRTLVRQGYGNSSGDDNFCWSLFFGPKITL